MDKATIKIPKSLYLSLKERIRGTGFASVTDFITYVMRDIAAGGNVGDEPSLTKREIQQVRKRLKALGYL